MKVEQLHEWTTKQFSTLSQFQKKPIIAQKVNNNPKIKQKLIPELMETYKMKVEQLHE